MNIITTPIIIALLCFVSFNVIAQPACDKDRSCNTTLEEIVVKHFVTDPYIYGTQNQTNYKLETYLSTERKDLVSWMWIS